LAWAAVRSKQYAYVKACLDEIEVMKAGKGTPYTAMKLMAFFDYLETNFFSTEFVGKRRMEGGGLF